MAPLLTWGLPTSRHDDLLFGGQPAWPTARFNAADTAAQLAARDAGADTDLNPLANRTQIVDLTADDAGRAEILRRYRLFSRQPDEMIIFRALQRMHPRELDFDPRLYQYGGGYIYLVGAALGAAAVTHLIHLTSNLGFYLEHPDAFGRFFIVARCISLLFGALALAAVYQLARRAGGRAAGWIALVSVAGCPVFITAVLEAKPHLPSAAMILWATLSALRYRGRGRWRDALHLGWQAGYAFGLVLTGLAAALLWPVLLLLPSVNRRRTLLEVLAPGVLALAVYVITNPYVPYNWLRGRSALTSNIGNSTAMYRDQIRQAPQGAVRVAELLVAGAGYGVPILGTLGMVLMLRRRCGVTVLGAVCGLGMLALCILLGANKPAEFARFLILPVLLLNVAAAGFIANVGRRRPILGLLLTLAMLAMLGTPAYIRAFARDARGEHESRLLAARYLVAQMAPDDVVGVLQEPAPYAVPPLDFATRRVLWLPPTAPADLDRGALPAWLVFTADNDHVHTGAWWQSDYKLVARYPVPSSDTPIAWADKPVFIYRRAPSPEPH